MAKWGDALRAADEEFMHEQARREGVEPPDRTPYAEMTETLAELLRDEER